MIHSLRDIDIDSLNGTERIQNAADLPPAEATGATNITMPAMNFTLKG